jgi:hypothetical protein
VWKNPHPEKVIKSIDFISAQAEAAPFMLGNALTWRPGSALDRASR